VTRALAENTQDMALHSNTLMARALRSIQSFSGGLFAVQKQTSNMDYSFDSLNERNHGFLKIFEMKDGNVKQIEAYIKETDALILAAQTEKQDMIEELSALKRTLKDKRIELLRSNGKLTVYGALEAVCFEIRMAEIPKKDDSSPDTPDSLLARFLRDNKNFAEEFEQLLIKKNINVEEAKSIFPRLWQLAPNKTNFSADEAVELVDGSISEIEIYCLCALFKHFHIKYQRYTVDGTKYTGEDVYN
jgi:hypothetical protein